MKIVQVRNLHRDLGYFYVGLIISFAFSGILMNHREHWHPEKYSVQTKAISVNIPKDAEITEKYAEELGKQLGIDDKFRRHKVKENELKISFEKNDVEIDLKTGKGEVVTFVKTPIISQTMKLHKNTSNWWIYYSDIFGLSLITIALTGVIMIPAGKFTFKKRGWKLALAGLIIPLLILIFV
ncbi:PepSY-associated TM helix domain-containing protein [Flavobacterium croceum]|uniref:PepSY-associated TM helix domain-containing protein n=1 Tax=Flavobacterium croceum TaxID=370975 RepID=UPI0024A9EC85|nr:PepSY-associated TM helix domain-containing protein [Flavobacterium croceum]